MARHLFGILAFLTLLLGFSQSSYGVQAFHIVGATNNITSHFSATAPMVQTIINPTYRHLYVANGCTVPLAFSFTSQNATTLPLDSISTNPNQLFINASSASQFNFIGGLKYVWVRSLDTSTCIGGDVNVDLW